jgi:hypothetical protein
MPTMIKQSSSSNVFSRCYDEKNPKSEEADFIFSYSTLEDYVSYSDEKDGSLVNRCANVSAILRYAHLLVYQIFGTSFKYSGHLNVEKEIVEVKMVPTYKDRLKNLF